jgi:hypothetical protein
MLRSVWSWLAPPPEPLHDCCASGDVTGLQQGIRNLVSHYRSQPLGGDKNADFCVAEDICRPRRVRWFSSRPRYPPRDCIFEVLARAGLKADSSGANWAENDANPLSYVLDNETINALLAVLFAHGAKVNEFHLNQLFRARETPVARIREFLGRFARDCGHPYQFESCDDAPAMTFHVFSRSNQGSVGGEIDRAADERACWERYEAVLDHSAATGGSITVHTPITQDDEQSLHLAAALGFDGIVRKLLEPPHGVHPDILSYNGTPLAVAAPHPGSPVSDSKFSISVVQTLLSFGADPLAANCPGDDFHEEVWSALSSGVSQNTQPCADESGQIAAEPWFWTEHLDVVLPMFQQANPRSAFLTDIPLNLLASAHPTGVLSALQTTRVCRRSFESGWRLALWPRS